jgi:hypothetical protein
MLRKLHPRHNQTETPPNIPQGQRRTLEQLKTHHCRWPVGDPGAPDFFFCGAKRIEPLAYCEGHCRMAYRSAARVNGYVPDGGRRAPAVLPSRILAA